MRCRPLGRPPLRRRPARPLPALRPGRREAALGVSPTHHTSGNAPARVSLWGAVRKPSKSGTEKDMDETARKNAAEALQRALDRRDNGGTTGH